MRFAGAEEYSFRGWWWFEEPFNGGEDQHAVIWVSGNPKARFAAGGNWQDNLFVIYLTRKEIRVCSYSLGKNGNEAGQKEVCSVQLITGRRSELYWIYTYFSYSRITRSWYLLLKIDGQRYEFRREVRHMRLSYLGWYWLYDGVRSGFRGSVERSFFSVGGEFVTDDAEKAIEWGGNDPTSDDNLDTSHLNITDRVFTLTVDDGEA